jgi:hypothetical protein
MATHLREEGGREGDLVEDQPGHDGFVSGHHTGPRTRAVQTNTATQKALIETKSMKASMWSDIAPSKI